MEEWETLMSSRKFALVIDVFAPDQECFEGLSEPWLASTSDCSAEFLFSEEFETAEEALNAQLYPGIK